jgi:hypothetical protein
MVCKDKKSKNQPRDGSPYTIPVDLKFNKLPRDGSLFAYFECAEVLGKWCEEGQESQDLPRLLLLTQAPADTCANSIF